MRKALVVLLGVCLLALFVGSVSARDIDRSGKRFVRNLSEEENPALIDQGARSLMTSAAVDTYCIVWYDFEPASYQGFTRVDNTAQVNVWWHVDDFDGLLGGDFGGLYALEGTKSMWCGSRPGTDTYLCSWVYAPGYGNNWNQDLESDAFFIYQAVEFTYKIAWDSEEGYDYSYVQYDAGGGNWTTIPGALYDVTGSETVTQVLNLAQLATKLRFKFVSDSAWSDADGDWNTDGAIIVDSLVIVDGNGLIDEETFETAALGATAHGIWTGKMADAFGIWAGMNSGLIDKEPCADNLSAQLTFWGVFGDPDPNVREPLYPSSDYPGYYETPFCTGPGGIDLPCQDEAVVSPVFSMVDYSTACDENQDGTIDPLDLPELRGAILRFTTYRDLPSKNNVFYTWSVRSIVGGCPGIWRDRNYVYYGPERDYIQNYFDVSDLVGSDPIQVRIGCSDMCWLWYEEPGDCSQHTPSPWLDNLRIHRYKTTGPSWSYRDLDLFNDTFPKIEWIGAGSELEWYCVADAANDIAPDDEVRIMPGDSSVVTVSAPMAGGLDTLVTGEARVYMHVNASYIGGGTTPPDFTGAQMQGDYGTYLYDEGDWSVYLCDSARTSGGSISTDKYSCDLNDGLFTRGWMIEYYFKAYDALGYASTLPGSAEETDGNIFEFTCLPLMNVTPTALYCDDYEHRGTFKGLVQQYYDPAFEAVVPSDNDLPDRYDTNAPTSGVANGVGAYVSAEGGQAFFNEAYEKIIFDSGNLDAYTITDGVSDKSNDAKLLNDWMQYANGKAGLLVMGDAIADDLSQSTAPSVTTLLANCGITLVNESYYSLTGGDAGGVVSPMISGVAGTFMDGLSYYIYGGCPIINSFDVLEKSGDGQWLLEYPDYPVGSGVKYYAGISTEVFPSPTRPRRTVWVGHSFMYIRNASNTISARNEFLYRVYTFFENDTAVNYTDDPSTPKNVYNLAQNFPNPFNPTTTISFSLRDKGHVSLKVYNVAGQLVKTLSDEVWDAGSHDLTWDGTNNLGASVASGVYFYKLDADGNYENMKKMVLLR